MRMDEACRVVAIVKFHCDSCYNMNWKFACTVDSDQLSFSLWWGQDKDEVEEDWEESGHNWLSLKERSSVPHLATPRVPKWRKLVSKKSSLNTSISNYYCHVCVPAAFPKLGMKMAQCRRSVNNMTIILPSVTMITDCPRSCRAFPNDCEHTLPSGPSPLLPETTLLVGVCCLPPHHLCWWCPEGDSDLQQGSSAWAPAACGKVLNLVLNNQGRSSSLWFHACLWHLGTPTALLVSGESKCHCDSRHFLFHSSHKKF